MALQLHTIVSPPFAENSYILWQSGQSDAVVVDPGFDPQSILDFLSENSLRLVAILNTHGHVDHIAGNGAMKQAFPDAPLIIGAGDAPMLTDPYLNLSAAFEDEAIISPPADRLLHEGERVSFAGIDCSIREIPGHSPGHIVFIIDGANPPIIMGGDVLFRGSIGRTDFPGGDLRLLLSGIREKLWPLSDDAVVYPGHGPVTTIRHEKRTNPFTSGRMG